MTNQNESCIGVPVYRYNREYAASHNEKEAWKASYRANVRCKEALEKAISKHYENNRLHADLILAEINQDFSPERISYVLANTIIVKLHDERISESNKMWAKSVPVALNTKSECYQYDFALDKTHPVIIDAFVSAYRESQT